MTGAAVTGNELTGALVTGNVGAVVTGVAVDGALVGRLVVIMKLEVIFPLMTAVMTPPDLF